MSAFAISRRVAAQYAPFYGPADLAGRAIYVDTASGNDTGRDGTNPTRPLATVQEAVDGAVDFDAIYVSPGSYDETITVPVTLQYLSIVGLGGKSSTVILPTTTNASGIVNEADNVRLVNLDVRADGTGNCLQNRGSYFEAHGCTFGQAGAGIILTEGTAAEVAAGTYGTGTGPTFLDCDIRGVATGVTLTATDQGAMDDIWFIRCRFWDLPTASIEESGGTAANRFRNLLVKDCWFGAGDPDDGSAPTKWISLNDDNGNTGHVVGCNFPTAINSGLNLVSTAVDWVGNAHPAGTSTGQPS